MAHRKTDKLTPKQAAFVLEYLKDLNATEAAKRAGFSAKTCHVQGSVLLQAPHVAAAIEAAKQKRDERTQITVDKVVLELARVGFSDIRALFNDNGTLKKPSEMSADQAAAIAAIEVDEIAVGGKVVGHTRKLKFWNKTPALELLGKHLGAWVEKHQVEGTIEIIRTIVHKGRD